MSPPAPLHAVVIGAGISGLTTAYTLKKAGRNVLLLEVTDRAGGVIQSLDAEGFVIERGPNSLRGTHELIDLAEELGLMNELVAADPKAPAYVYFNGALHPVPMSPPALITTKLLSTSAKLRLLKEPFIKPRNESGEESLASFVRRRLGPELLDRLVAPFVSGIYAGDVERLSVQASFGKLADFEAAAGSILRGGLRAMKQAKQAAIQNPQSPQRSLKAYRLCSFKRGLQTLPLALAQALGESFITSAQVTQIKSQISNPKFQIAFERHGTQQTVAADRLIIATPADTAAGLLEDVAPALVPLLANIPYTSLVSVPLAYRVAQLARPLNGFGFLAPRSEGIRLLGSIWSSSLFPGRAPEGWVYCTNFIGGETDRTAVMLSDEELIRVVHGDLHKVLGVKGEPRRLPITRWPRAIPQYIIGHAERMRRIDAEAAKIVGLQIIGNYLHGVSIGDCLKNAKTAAEVVA